MRLLLYVRAVAFIIPQAHAYFYGSVFATWPLPAGHKVTWLEVTTYVPEHSYDIPNVGGSSTVFEGYIGSSNYSVVPWKLQRPSDWRFWINNKNGPAYFPNSGYSPPLAAGDIIRTIQTVPVKEIPQNFKIDWSITPGVNGTALGEVYQSGSFNTSLPANLQNNPNVQLTDLATLRIFASYYWNFGPVVFDNIYMEADTINTTWCTTVPKKTIYVAPNSQAKDVQITIPQTPIAKIQRGNVYSSCNISRVIFTQVD